MREGRAVEVSYQTLQASKPGRRWITPHALSFDGLRWQARAWCHQRSRFLDFVLARISNVHGDAESKIDNTADRAWHTKAIMRFGPNPALPPAHRHAVELDFGMVDGVIEVEIRLSLIYYLKRQMLLDVADRLSPERVPLVVLNSDELNALLASTDEELL